MKLTWKAPSSTGGSAITGYVIKPSIGAAVTVGKVTSYTITKLTNGTAYTFTVAAKNSGGNRHCLRTLEVGDPRRALHRNQDAAQGDKGCEVRLGNPDREERGGHRGVVGRRAAHRPHTELERCPLREGEQR